jgi:hypothetical protein
VHSRKSRLETWRVEEEVRMEIKTYEIGRPNVGERA